MRFSIGYTALKKELNGLKKYQPWFADRKKSAIPNLMENCWSFDDLPKSFAGFYLDFA